MQSSAAPSGLSSPSNDTFPAFPAPAGLNNARGGPSTPRRPSQHPQISRLRSMSTQQRFASNSSYSTALEFPQTHSPGTPGFDLRSRQSSASNLFDIGQSSDLVTPADSSPAPTETGRPRHETFKWSALKRVSARVYPPAGRGGVGLTTIGGSHAGMLGPPTVMAVSGIIAVGTSKGWTMCFDFNQNLRCVCGNEGIGECGGSWADIQ